MTASVHLTNLRTDPRLSTLETRLRRPRQFNILTTLGLSRQELRHSDLLSYLLDSRQNHGFGDRFARALLSRVAPLLPDELAVSTLVLNGMIVQREWNFIDVFIESPLDRVVVIIENKLDSLEHSDQLGRYYRFVQERYPGWRIVGIYLTLDGSLPDTEADRASYATLSYTDIAAMLSELAAEPQIDPDVQTLLLHYAEQIRSELVPDADSNATRLARELYMEHPGAFDAVLRARDARQKMIRQCFDGLLTTTIRAQPDLLRRDDYNTNISIQRWHTRFAPVEWYRSDLQVAQGWTNSKLVLLFQFIHEPGQIWIDLGVGPAPRAVALRHALYDLAASGPQPFTRWWGESTGDWFSIYGRMILTKETNFFAAYDDETIRRAIREHWLDFLQRDLPMIRAAIRHEILGAT